jgi:hypothetical protein
MCERSGMKYLVEDASDRSLSSLGRVNFVLSLSSSSPSSINGIIVFGRKASDKHRENPWRRERKLIL